MHQPYTFRLTAQSELSFNLTYEGYARGVFNQKCFQFLRFSVVPNPMAASSCCGRPHLRDFDDLSLGIIGRHSPTCLPFSKYPERIFPISREPLVDDVAPGLDASVLATVDALFHT